MKGDARYFFIVKFLDWEIKPFKFFYVFVSILMRKVVDLLAHRL